MKIILDIVYHMLTIFITLLRYLKKICRNDLFHRLAQNRLKGDLNDAYVHLLKLHLIVRLGSVSA